MKGGFYCYEKLSHLATGLGRSACEHGYDVRFFRVAQLVEQNLCGRQADGRTWWLNVMHCVAQNSVLVAQSVCRIQLRNTLPAKKGGYRNRFRQFEDEFVVPMIFGTWDVQGQNRNRTGIIGLESPEIHPHRANK